jgi:hypothetical protein
VARSTKPNTKSGGAYSKGDASRPPRLATSSWAGEVSAFWGGDAMCFLFSFIPATLCVVLGYFILFSSTKAQGAVQMFGQILAFWVFILAAFFPVMGTYVTFAGLCPISGVSP